MQLYERALKKRWGMSDEERGRIKDEMLSVLEHTDAGLREKIWASRVLVQIEGQDQADDHLNMKYTRADQGLPEETIVLRATFDE